MNIFTSKRETFLVAALAAIGLSEQDLAAQVAAGNTNFLADAIAPKAAAETELASLKASAAATAGILAELGLKGADLRAEFAAVIADREAKARAEGERAAGLKAAEELAARGVPAVPVAAAAAADAPKKPGDGLNGLQKVQAIIAAQISTQNQAHQ